MAVFVFYLGLSVVKFGLSSGVSVAALSWSFFVFCTPIADAGALLDFPVRLITGFRMFYSEILVWIVAFVINLVALTTAPDVYQKTELLKLFHDIITTPWPMWIIILLSAIGTFLSVHLADDTFDIGSAHDRKIAYQKQRTRLVISSIVFALTIIAYIIVLHTTHTHINIL